VSSVRARVFVSVGVCSMCVPWGRGPSAVFGAQSLDPYLLVFCSATAAQGSWQWPQGRVLCARLLRHRCVCSWRHVECAADDAMLTGAATKTYS
jgi:hypothetical protein